MTKHVRVLVVDDSSFMRRAIVRMLGSDPHLEVVGQAADGAAAMQMLDQLDIDVVTLDLEMPGVGGLAVLEHIRERHDVEVVVLSGAGLTDPDLALRALDMGAFDFVAKPQGGALAIHDVSHDLVAKVREAAGLERRTASSVPAAVGARPPALPTPYRGDTSLAVDVVVIGTSTGGPQALHALLGAMPADFPVPIVIAQHMPAGYTKALAARLDQNSALVVREAADGETLEAGVALIAPAGNHLGFRAGSTRGPRVAITHDCPIPSYYRPCIDHTLQETARVFGRRALAVILTGMGADGAVGVRAVKAAGGHVWAQDEESCVIFGMPRAAIETGDVEEIVPLSQLAQKLAACVTRARPGIS